MEPLLAFIAAVVVAFLIIQLTPYKIRVKSEEEKAMDGLINEMEKNFQNELDEAQS